MNLYSSITTLTCLTLLAAACSDAGGGPSESPGFPDIEGASGGAGTSAVINGAGGASTGGGAGGSASQVAGAGGGHAGAGGSAIGGAAGGGGTGMNTGGAGGSGGTPGHVASGAPGVWEHITLPGTMPGDQYQSLANDPVRPSDFYFAAGHNGDGRVIRWWKSTDFGATWTVINSTSIHGDPWGFSIDPNPNRDPKTPPTIWSPAGYGDLGAWKSTDGGQTWARSAGADTAFKPFNPNGGADLYHLQILPDDPPNHVLATYHYGFKSSPDGGVGETWDGGKTWVVHPPAAGMGTSHYVIPISATTWCVIAQDNGIWRTTTAGRTGGTPEQKFRDGTISTAAWKKVDDQSHMHGSHANLFVGGAWYAGGINTAKKSADQGATWQTVASGFSISVVAATTSFLYGAYGFSPTLSRASRTSDTVWDRAYTKTPSEMTGGPSPFGISSAYDPGADRWVVLLGFWDTGLWRYVEP